MNTRTTGTRVLVAGLAVGSMLLTAACGSGSDGGGGGEGDALRVGLLMSTTGPAAPYGISERNGARVVLDDINKRGGINGTKIKIIEGDDKSDPTEAAQAARKLILQDKIDVLIGPTTGGSTLAVGPIAAANKIPVLAPGGGIQTTSKDNAFWPWIFRTSPSDLVTVKAMVDQIIKEGDKKFAIFAEETPYGDGTLKYLEELLGKDSSLELSAVARAAATATDFSAQATKLNNAKPDVVLLVTSAPAVGAGITRAIRQTGSDVPLWGPIGLAQQGYIDSAGKASEGAHMMAMNDWNNPSEGEQELGKLLTAAGYKGTSFETAGSNGAQVLEAAAKTVKGEYTGPKVRDALTKVSGVETYGLGQSISYTADERDGLEADSLTMLVVKDGKFVTYKP